MTTVNVGLNVSNYNVVGKTKACGNEYELCKNSNENKYFVITNKPNSKGTATSEFNMEEIKCKDINLDVDCQSGNISFSCDGLERTISIDDAGKVTISE